MKLVLDSDKKLLSSQQAKEDHTDLSASGFNTSGLLRTVSNYGKDRQQRAMEQIVSLDSVDFILDGFTVAMACIPYFNHVSVVVCNLLSASIDMYANEGKMDARVKNHIKDGIIAGLGAFGVNPQLIGVALRTFVSGKTAEKILRIYPEFKRYVPKTSLITQFKHKAMQRLLHEDKTKYARYSLLSQDLNAINSYNSMTDHISNIGLSIAEKEALFAGTVHRDLRLLSKRIARRQRARINVTLTPMQIAIAAARQPKYNASAPVSSIQHYTIPNASLAVSVQKKRINKRPNPKNPSFLKVYQPGDMLQVNTKRFTRKP